MNYPEKLIRGISNNDFVDKEGRLLCSAFQFDENPDRIDDLLEASINWHDDSDALQEAFERKKNNSAEYQFKAGIAVLSRSKIDEVIVNAKCTKEFSYERNIMPDNKYHGNLLLAKSTSKQLKNAVVGMIALLCVEDLVKR